VQTAEARRALVVANSTFVDPVFRKLTAPPVDADALAAVLSDEQLCDFTVTEVLVDRPCSQVQRAIEKFFLGDDVRAGDMRLLYFSGHGIKNDDGVLYLPTTDTDHKLLRSTAIDSRFVNDVMEGSTCRRQILVLDACYSGAFGRAMLGKGDDLSVGVKERFGSRGRCVLAASDSMQQAFEGEVVSGQAQPSIFTRALVEGIKHGTADLDHDGWITFNELSTYIEDRLLDLGPEQRPMKFALEEQGELLMSRAPSAIEREFGSPPRRSADRLARLRTALDEAIPAKRTGTEQNLLICTWNIRAMGSLTPKWQSTAHDTPKRDLTDLYCIAEIVRRFDVTVISEVKGADNLNTLRFLTAALGKTWSFTVTSPSLSLAGNEERRAFVFDVARVRPSGLAGDMAAELPDVERAYVQEAFVDAPYAMTFESSMGAVTFAIIHPVLNSRESTAKSASAFFRSLRDWAERQRKWGNDLLVLGDFNLDRKGDPVIDSARATGLSTIENLNSAPRTIFDQAAKGSTAFNDQISYFVDAEGPLLATRFRTAGSFDFTAPVEDIGTRTEIAWRISDHLPLWAELG
jgi:hypothetical protein